MCKAPHFFSSGWSSLNFSKKNFWKLGMWHPFSREIFRQNQDFNWEMSSKSCAKFWPPPLTGGILFFFSSKNMKKHHVFDVYYGKFDFFRNFPSWKKCKKKVSFHRHVIQKLKITNSTIFFVTYRMVIHNIQ